MTPYFPTSIAQQGQYVTELFIVRRQEKLADMNPEAGLSDRQCSVGKIFNTSSQKETQSPRNGQKKLAGWISRLNAVFQGASERY